MINWDETKPFKCNNCDDGWRHAIGNCVICGYGPAPKWHNLPSTRQELAMALASVGIFGLVAEAIIVKHDFVADEQN